jgi:hypothetical protein
MKTTILTLSCAALLAASAFGEEVVTTTTSSGTIQEYSPGSTFVVRESSGPVHYRYGKKVTYVTRGGRVLSDADVKRYIRVGRPVHVHYDMDNDARIVNKIEVDDDDGAVKVDRDDDD